MLSIASAILLSWERVRGRNLLVSMGMRIVRVVLDLWESAVSWFRNTKGATFKIKKKRS